MKLERLQEYVVPVVTTLAGMAFAFVLGKLLGQGQIGKAMMMLGILFLGFLTMVLRQYIWLLLVVGWGWTGQIVVLPVPLAVRDMCVLATCVSLLALISLKVVRRKPSYGLADLAMLSVLLYLVMVFVRNPVGLLAMNSFRVGGRPYYNIGIAFIAYWVLCRASIPVRSGSRVVMGVILSSAFGSAFLNLIADFSPKIAMGVMGFYNGLSVEMAAENSGPDLPPDEKVERFGYLGILGNIMGLTLISTYRPNTLLNPLRWGRFLLFALSAVGVLLSGFRSGVIALGVYFAISSFLRNGWRDLIRLALPLMGCLGLLLLGQGRLFDLPLAAQRALTFLPGKWSYAARESAKSSSEWRFYMWRIFLQGSRYVHNHSFGDGFGISKQDMLAISLSSNMDTREIALIVGGVHSGPLSAVRVVGYVGLALYLTALVFVATEAWQLARRARGTPFLPMTLFVAVPAIYEPFNYVFVFGAFDSSVPTALFTLGMLRMVRNTLDDYVDESQPGTAQVENGFTEPQRALVGAHR